tara:strand:- start:144 stop:782 length:639 start_codon:yes stop_codon:yes gene_type:complete
MGGGVEVIVVSTTALLLALTTCDPAPLGAFIINVTSETLRETAILDRASICDRAKDVDRELMRDILAIERSAGVPAKLQGMTLAAACHESGMRPDAAGDCKCRGVKGLHQRPVTCPDNKPCKWKARGILQQWPWVERYGVDRLNPLEAAEFWIRHLASRVAQAAKDCDIPKGDIDRIWRTAWVTAVRAPSKRPRCRQKPRHWRRFTEWRKSW